MSDSVTVILIFSALLIIAYILSSHYITLSKITYIHESSLAIILGVFAAIILLEVFDTRVQFSDTQFFFAILPPIIFAAGYTLKGKSFMRNFHYIMMLGVVGTLLNMVVLSTVLLIGNKYLLSADSQLYPIECLLLASVLCATDTISVLSLISVDSYRTLNSILFGEGIVNDSVSILLFKSILELYKNQSGSNTNGVVIHSLDQIGIEPYEVVLMMVEFFKLSVASIICGVAIGLQGSYMLKRIPQINYHPNRELMIVIVMAYLSYLFAERMHISGVISLFCCGFTLSHYGYHNLSVECQHGSKLTIEASAQLAESFLYVYLGLSSINLKSDSNAVRIDLIGLVLIGLVFSRLISVKIPLYILSLLKNKESSNTNQQSSSVNLNPSTDQIQIQVDQVEEDVRQLNLEAQKAYRVNITYLTNNEILLITIGGIIRGAIAFALVLQVDSKHYRILITTTQVVVLLTTVVLGGSMGLITERLGIQVEVASGTNSKQQSESLLEKGGQMKQSKDLEGNESHKRVQEKQYSGVVLWWKNFDKKVMFPIFRKKEQIQESHSNNDYMRL